MGSRKTAAWRTGLRPATDAAGHGVVREGQTFAGQSLLVRYANLVKLPHTLFALPFALVGVVYASYTAPVTVRATLLVVVAFTAARFAAMGFNRIADRHLDAENPRTRSRELPSGRLSVSQAAWAVAVAALLFVGAAALLNHICFFLSPLALAWILTYSYAKRLTDWSHLWLGASLAIAPVGGYLAVVGRWSTPVWTLVALAGGVMTWVAGFDIFYALADEEFDRQHGLYSAVVRLGQTRSILLARGLHCVTIGLLGLFGWGATLGWVYYAGLGVAALLLAWEHRLVRSGDLSRLNAAFFTTNGVLSVVVFLGALGERLL